VTGVESAGTSLELLRRSADEARLRVKLVAGDAAAVARSFADPLDAVLLDRRAPEPRTRCARWSPCSRR